MGPEVFYALGALFAVGLFLVLVRRASARSQLGDGGQSIPRKLREAAEAAEAAKAAEAAEAKPATPASAPARDRQTVTDESERRDRRAKREAREREARAVKAAPGGGRMGLPSRVFPGNQELEDRGEGDDDELAERAPGPAAIDGALREGLAKTRGGFVARLGRLFARKQIDESVLGELEEVLLTADIGPRTAEKLFGAIRGALSRDELTDPEAIWAKLREESSRILDLGAAPVDFSGPRPFVLLVLGVNGVGKTTTIGKLAAKLGGQGLKVLLAAGDTFRAAATEQLEVWGSRTGCPVVKGKSGGDPSSVIFDAVKRGQAEGYDVVIADTAGRLHTKVELMEELKKVGRVIDKAMPGAPHETWLVLDATTGQNAIQQAQLFKEAMKVTGIVLTKLDGTAKGGVILGIANEMAVPVRFIGIGEKVDDLREFDPAAFVAALYGRDESANAA